MSFEIIHILNFLVEKGYIVSYRVTKNKVYVIIKK
jgi:DNA-binding PadR family transcriptional regulator